MEEEVSEDKRYRSPSFYSEEVNTLLNLIEKYKLFVLNKSTTSAASQSKAEAWDKIAKEYNRLGFEHVRSADNLKMKWDNLKRDVRKITNKILEHDHSFGVLNSELTRVAALVAAAENMGTSDVPVNVLEEDDLLNFDSSKEASNSLDGTAESDEDYEKQKRKRASNFSPQECRLLLQCVKKEKDIVLAKENSSNILELKNQAWSRITDSYNRLSPQKRSTQVLRNKLANLKTMVKKAKSKKYFKFLKHHKHGRLTNEDCKGIKQEPLFEDKMESESESDMENDDVDVNEKSVENYVALPDPDPLSSVLNGDSGMGSSQTEPWNWDSGENKDLIKMKKEILNYQMETAKLERKRIENLLQEDAVAREARATETALRLRTARLEAIAAAMKLPPAHPALQFTQEEARAQYVLSYHQT